MIKLLRSIVLFNIFLLAILTPCPAPADTFTGTLDATTQSKTHSITLASDGALSLSITIDATLNLKTSYGIRLFDANGTTTLESYTGPDGSTSTTGSYGPVALKAGSYFISVNRYTGSGTYTLTTTFSAQSLANDTEPNDAFQNAQTITPGSAVTGHLGYMGGGSGTTVDTQDWLKIVLETDGTLSINIKIDATLNLTNTAVYDANGSTVLDTFTGPVGGSDIDKTYDILALKAGTYYIRPYRSQDYGGYTLTATFTAQSLLNDTEPNDAFQNAQALPPATAVTGHLGYMGGGAGTGPDTQDWWKIVLDTDGTLSFNIKIDATLDLSGTTLYDGNGSTQLQNTTGPVGGSDIEKNSNSIALKAGTYYIRPYRSQGYGGYTLTVTFSAQTLTNDTEPNDVYQNAQPLTPGTAVTGLLGYTGTGTTAADTQDWWKFVLDADGTLTINIKIDATLNLSGATVYDTNGTTYLQSFTGPVGGSEIEKTYDTVALKAGTYYLRLSHADGYGGYTLTATYTAQTLSNDNETNDTFNTAQAINLDTPFTGHLGYIGGGAGSTADSLDWFQFTLAVTGAVTLSITVDATLNLNYTSSIQLIDADGKTALQYFNGPAGGNELKATFDPLTLGAGTYYIAISLAGGYGGYTMTAAFSEDNGTISSTTTTTGSGSITTTTIEGSAENKKAIIVAGGGPFNGNALWEATTMLASYAYKALLFQGFTSDSIYYLTADTGVDVNGDGIPDADAEPTTANLQTALTVWAADADDVILYMVDHGGKGMFRMSAAETLYATNLSLWLGTLQNSISGTLVVIYDACQSGSFLPLLVPPAGKQRISITSSSDSEAAYFLTAGNVSFSHFFWSNVFNGSNLRDAFILAKDAMSSSRFQNALLDDNGNGMGNEKEDGDLANNYVIGMGKTTGEDIPVIASVSNEQTLFGRTDAEIWADGITSSANIVMVWALIKEPQVISDNASQPVVDANTVVLTQGVDNRYSGTYDDFSTAGTYYISVYALDQNANISLPQVTTVLQTLGDANCPAENVFAPDDPRLSVLRQFRDTRLSKTACGRMLIQLYYAKGPELISIMDKYPSTKSFMQNMLSISAACIKSLF